MHTFSGVMTAFLGFIILVKSKKYSAGSTAFFIFWLLLGTIQAEAETIGSQVVHKV